MAREWGFRWMHVTRQRPVGPKEFAAFMAVGLGVVIFGVIWGVREGGPRGVLVAVSGIIGIGLAVYIGWLLYRNRKR
jgi:hypothetical protein